MNKWLVILIGFSLLTVLWWFVSGSSNELETSEQPTPTPKVTSIPTDSATLSLPAGSPSAQKTSLDDQIRLESPQYGATVTSPVRVMGEARGTWFFEASFPVVLTDWDGKILVEVPAEAQADWMTEEMVPFEATLEYEIPVEALEVSRQGSLILRKANPSGLAENDEALEVPVLFGD